MEHETRRISLVIREDQHKKMSETGVNASGLIRDLLDDHYSQNKINLNVSAETHALYSQIVSQAPYGDTDIEPYLRRALAEMLTDKIKAMETLKTMLKK